MARLRSFFFQTNGQRSVNVSAVPLYLSESSSVHMSLPSLNGKCYLKVLVHQQRQRTKIERNGQRFTDEPLARHMRLIRSSRWVRVMKQNDNAYGLVVQCVTWCGAL